MLFDEFWDFDDGWDIDSWVKEEMPIPQTNIFPDDWCDYCGRSEQNCDCDADDDCFDFDPYEGD